MEDLYVAMVLGILIVLGSMISVELGLSVAIVEIVLGVVAGNVFGIHPRPWLDFLAGFASIVLTFLAGAEVDPDLLRAKLKQSALIGGVSFLAPFALCWAFAQFVLGWEPRAAQIVGTALSTTSLAVVYAVLVETGLTNAEIGKLIMASTFITDFGTAAALSLLFIQPTPWLVAFIAVSAAAIWAMPRLQSWFFGRYGNRVIEPEIKGAFAVLFVLMYFGALAESHAVLPAFLLGLAVARVFHRHRLEQQRFRVVAFAFLTPFFFLSSLYGLNAGIINQEQFSVLVTVVVLTAIVPTAIAQRWFTPHVRRELAGTGGGPSEGTVHAAERV